MILVKVESGNKRGEEKKSRRWLRDKDSEYQDDVE